MEVWQLSLSLLGVILAFIVGFFAEPIKLFFTNRNEKNLLRKALYQEMAFMYSRLNNIGHMNSIYDWETFKKSLISLKRTEAYDYAKTKPMLFYQLKEASAINQVYSNFNVYFDGFLFKNVNEHIANAAPVARILEMLVADGDLNKDLLLQSFSKDIRESVQQRLHSRPNE
jgi:hypothetical protein